MGLRENGSTFRHNLYTQTLSHPQGLMFRYLFSATIGLTALLFFSSSLLADQIVRYPQAGEHFQKHHRYPIELLELALSYASERIELQPSQYFMTQSRAIRQLYDKKDIDVMWTMTSTERETEIRPIRIPIYKGLIGWRLFLSTKEWLNSHALQPTLANLDEFRKHIFIQGHDWPDAQILEFNQFNLVTGSDYEGLFQILSLNRVELFPRSIIEVWDELENHAQSNIRLEPNLLISYPTASYFFVSPDNTALANTIENGLNQALNDGRFDALFNRHFEKMIADSGLNKRTHYRLANPLLPKNTPLDNKKYWFSLEQD